MAIEEAPATNGTAAAEPELVTPAKVSAEPQEPVEPELDEPEGSQPGAFQVTMNELDATPNIIFSPSRGLLSSIRQHGFQHLISGIRANVGAKAGRYAFEVQVAEIFHGHREYGPELRVGFSTSRGTLQLGDPSSEGCGIDGKGHFLDYTASSKSVAGPLLQLWSVITLVLNLRKDTATSNTISVFVNGRRACPPQALPEPLVGQALYPVISFRGLSLKVNLGDCHSKLPFRCRMFTELGKDDGVPFPKSVGPPAVLVPVGLPETSFLKSVDELLKETPGAVEISGRALESWCCRSGLRYTRKHQPTVGCEEPDLAFGLVELEKGAWRPAYESLVLEAQGYQSLVVNVRNNLLQEERAALLKKVPLGARKVAIVLIDEDSVNPKEDPPSDKATSSSVGRFSLPSEEEGFDEIRYKKLTKDAAEAVLVKWLRLKKVHQLLADLKPGLWFKGKKEAWSNARVLFRERTQKFAKEAQGDANRTEKAASVDMASVEDIHDVDGEGTPLYVNFKFEDWLLLSVRYELHLLAHAYIEDADDPDRSGILEAQLPFYYHLYFGAQLDPMGRLGVASAADVVRIQKEPVVLEAGEYGLLLRSSWEKETPLEAFVKAVEADRRDRTRRYEAGDETATLNFPRAPSVKAAPARMALRAPPPPPVPKPKAKSMPKVAAKVLRAPPPPQFQQSAQVPQSPALLKPAPAKVVPPPKAAPVKPGLVPLTATKRANETDGDAAPALDLLQPKRPRLV